MTSSGACAPDLLEPTLRLPKMSSGQVRALGRFAGSPGVVLLADRVGVLAREAVTAG